MKASEPQKVLKKTNKPGPAKIWSWSIHTDSKILTAINFSSDISLTSVVSLPSQVCFWISFPFSRVTTVFTKKDALFNLLPSWELQLVKLVKTLTVVFLSSAVVSSNGSFSLNLISVDLKALCDFMQINPWSSALRMKLGLVLFPTWRVAKPTPKIKYKLCNYCTNIQHYK